MREFDHFISPFLAGMPGGTALGRQHGHAAWQPPVDIFDVGDSLLVIAELPGVKDDQVRVSVEQGSLTLSGYRAKIVPENTRHVHHMEIPHGEFRRVLDLPEGVDVLCISAEYKEGYLMIRIPWITGHE